MVDNYCIGCEHYWASNKLMNTHACLYILNTGKARPCPSGKSCTVRKKAKRRRYKWVGKAKP